MTARQRWTPQGFAALAFFALSLFTLPEARGQTPGPATQPATQPTTAPSPPPPPPKVIEPGGVKEQAAPPTPGKKKKSFPLQAYYEDGFGVRTTEKTLELKIGASAQLDTRFYGGDSVAPQSFDIRRARLDFQAKIWKRFDIRIQAALEDGTPYIRNAFGDVRIWDFLHIRGGQMKVPFSSQWLAFDNQVDFMERATAEPLYPFFDRGAMLWGTFLGERITYMFGIYTGAGVDVDYPKGDNDSNKDIAWRLFLQPFRGSPLPFLEGIYLAGDGTWGFGNVPSKRFETRGLAAANFESQVWRWRGDQTLGTNGRNTDSISAEYDSRTRFGAELHYLVGPFTFSAEWAHVKYDRLALFHDFYQGATRLRHDPVLERDGGIHSVSAFLSWFITGEGKLLDGFGWKQPTPKRPLFFGGQRGPGAFEVLARFSATITDKQLFDGQRVNGYTAADLTENKLAGDATGQGSSVTAALLQGAPTLYEVTAGINWTMNYHLRIQLDYIYLHAADYAVDDKGTASGGIISGGNSDLYSTLKSKQVKSEHSVGLRLIIRI